MRKRLTSTPILRVPVFRKVIRSFFELFSSNVGLGAVLLYEIEVEDRWPMLVRNYYPEKASTGYRNEIILGVENFRKYLYGKEFWLETGLNPCPICMISTEV